MRRPPAAPVPRTSAPTPLRAWGLTLVNLAARAAHLVLFLAIGNRYGASELTDTLFFLQAPLVVLAGVMASAAELVVMPAVHRAAAAGAERAMVLRLLRNGLALVVPATLVALAAAALWSPVQPSPLVLLLLAPIPAAATAAAVAGGVLHAHERHRRAVLGPLYGSLAAGVVLVATPLSGPGLAAVLVTFELVRAAGLGWDARRALPREAAPVALPAALSAWPARTALFYLAAAALSSVNLLVDMLFASRLPEGAVTQVEYASRLWNAVPLLLSGHLFLVHARLSRSAAGAPERPGEGRTLHAEALVLGGLGVVLSLAGALAAPWGIDLLYGFGRLTAVQREVLAGLLVAYLAGAGPFLAALVYIRGLTARGRQVPVAAVAAAGIVVNASLDALLVGPLGVHGIGLATSLTYAVNTVALAVLARR